LEERLKAIPRKAMPKKDWRQSYQELNGLRERIFARRDGQPLSPEPDEIIWQMREERTAEIMQSLRCDRVYPGFIG
jgi:hypothetical protein